jgi:cytochrome c-type biogenesis protein CcmH
MTDPTTSMREQLRQLEQLHEAGALDAKQYQSSKERLERKLADSGKGAGTTADVAGAAVAGRASARMWAGAAVAIVLIAGAGYWWTGSPTDIGQAPAGFGAGGGTAAPHELGQEQMSAMIERLAERMKSRPDDAQGWSMLGRSYMALGRHAEAVDAYERVIKLLPDNAAVLADYADALGVKNGRSLEGEPLKIIERALKIDPDELKSLLLAGTAAFNRNDYAKAVQYWDRAAQVGPPDNPLAQQARAGAEEARQRGKLPGAAPDSAKPVTASPAASANVAVGGAITGTVTLAPALKGKVAPEDAIFIFARPATGSRMPLALLRAQVKDLPMSFTLDDSLSLSPAARLSNASEVVVGARISKSGQAMPQPGDLEGLTAPTAVGSSGVKVLITSEVK